MRSASVLASFAVLAVVAACSGESGVATNDPEQTGSAPECKKGEREACECPDGTSSTRSCSGDRTWGACACSTGPSCGNDKCEPGETCQSCAQDCGACPVCTEARACRLRAAPPGAFSGAPALDVRFERLDADQIAARLVVDAERGAPGLVALARALEDDESAPRAVHALRDAIRRAPELGALLRRSLGRADLASALARGRTIAPAPVGAAVMSGDGGASGDAGPDAGALGACTDPAKLRLRINEVTVHEEDDDVANDIVYCQVIAQGPSGSELRITPRTPNLDEGESHTFGGLDGTFWGQKAARDPSGDLTLQYDCFEQDDAKSYARLVQKAGEVLAEQTQDYLEGEGYGWVTTVIDLAARYLPQLLALDSDDHLLVASQVIPRSEQLALAKGASWTVRKKGTHLNSKWDWALEIQAWGCVENGTE